LSGKGRDAPAHSGRSEDFQRLGSRASEIGDWKRARARGAAKVAELLPADAAEIADFLTTDEFKGNPQINALFLKRLQDATAENSVWADIANSDSLNDDAVAIAREKIGNSLNTIEDLILLEESSSEDGLTGEQKEKAKSLILTKEDCEKVIADASGDGFLFEFAMDRLLDFSATPAECVVLYARSLREWVKCDDYNESILEKLFSLATPSEVVILATLGDKFGNLGKEAKKRLPKE